MPETGRIRNEAINRALRRIQQRDDLPELPDDWRDALNSPGANTALTNEQAGTLAIEIKAAIKKSMTLDWRNSPHGRSEAHTAVTTLLCRAGLNYRLARQIAGKAVLQQADSEEAG